MTKKIMATLFFMTLFSHAFAGNKICEELKKEHSELREELAPLREKIESDEEAGEANSTDIKRKSLILHELSLLSKEIRKECPFEIPRLPANKA